MAHGPERSVRPGKALAPVCRLQTARQQWVSVYETRSTQFAACRFIDQLGATTLCSAAQTFVIWHDERSKAHSSLALA
jgi:type IV secretory pathway TrbF-like protein